MIDLGVVAEGKAKVKGVLGGQAPFKTIPLSTLAAWPLAYITPDRLC